MLHTLLLPGQKSVASVGSRPDGVGFCGGQIRISVCQTRPLFLHATVLGFVEGRLESPFVKPDPCPWMPRFIVGQEPHSMNPGQFPFAEGTRRAAAVWGRHFSAHSFAARAKECGVCRDETRRCWVLRGQIRISVCQTRPLSLLGSAPTPHNSFQTGFIYRVIRPTFSKFYIVGIR